MFTLSKFSLDIICKNSKIYLCIYSYWRNYETKNKKPIYNSHSSFDSTSYCHSYDYAYKNYYSTRFLYVSKPCHYPIVIVLRALSHLFFGLLGALYLRKYPKTLDKPIQTWILNIVLAFVHAIAEVLACLVFYASTSFPENMFYLLFILVGVGTIIHSIVDFIIAQFIYKTLQKIR